MTYFIKQIYGPAAQTEQYPQTIIHFAKGREAELNRFLNCHGFLLYETGSGGGAKAIYGYGTVSSNQNRTVSAREANGVTFTLGAWVDTVHVVNPQNGVPLQEMTEVLGIYNIQRRGGIVEITEEQFANLKNRLLMRAR